MSPAAIKDRNYFRKRERVGEWCCSFHDASKRQVTRERRTVMKVLRDMVELISATILELSYEENIYGHFTKLAPCKKDSIVRYIKCVAD